MACTVVVTGVREVMMLISKSMQSDAWLDCVGILNSKGGRVMSTSMLVNPNNLASECRR